MMMVMRFFRKNFSVIIWAVVVVFIGGFVILSSMSRTETQRNIAFKVGKQQYTTIAFRERLDQTRRMLLNENREFNEDDLKKDILNSFVNEAVMTKFGVDMKIVVTGEDVQNYIQAQQSFQVNGSFSYDRYEDLLQRNGISMSMYESQVKLSLLVQQLSAMINNTNLISPLYMNEVGRMPSLDFEVKYATVPLKEITEKISINDEGINKYYSEKMTDFFVEPEVKIGWAEMPIEVSQEDEDSLISQLEGIKKQIAGNTITFETAAKAYSQGPSASKGGDLGWFDNDTMVDAFNKVAFKLKKGQISKPFQTKFGFHIVQKVDEKVENGKIMVQARHILLKLQVSDEQKDVVYNRALTAYSEMSQGAKIGDLFKSVNRTGLLSKETLPFKQMEEVFEFGEEDTAGYPFFLSADEENEKKGRYVVYQVIEKKKGFYKTVAEVSDQIRQILERE
ncbi:peptidylprolyl isomerase, partial [bacterium]|nr:peptidylprolyl isomerase [bacterium]